MWHQLLKIPHPTWTELLISTQLVIWGLLVKASVQKIEKEEELLRKALIRRHVKHHKGRFVYCKCSTRTALEKLNQTDLEKAEPQYLFAP